MNRLKFWSQIEKLNNKTKSNIEEFIDIAKQIQEINSRTKIDPIQERKWRLEKLEGTKYLSYIFKIENKKATEVRTRTTFTKMYYTRTTTRTVLKIQMGVRCVTITPIVLTSFSNKGLCNITYTQSKIKGLCLIFNRMLNY